MQHLPLSEPPPPSPAPPSAGRRWALRAAKLGLTGAIIAFLVRDVQGHQLRDMLAAADPRWLLVGLVLKTVSLVTHDLRTWQALPPKRPPVVPVIGLGLAMAVVNTVLPARAGDVALVAALRARFNVPATTGAAVIGVTSVVEAGALAIMILGTLALGAASWTALLGADVVTNSVLLLLGALVAAAVGAASIVVLARVLADRELPGPLAVFQRLLGDLAGLFSSARRLGVNMGLAGIQVFFLVLAFACGLPALGLDLSDPVLTASGILALSALAGFVLPSTWGAGPAAASVALLTPQGVSDEGILLYAGAYWLIAHVPVLMAGLPALWWERSGPQPAAAPGPETSAGAPSEEDAPAVPDRG